MSKNFKGYMGDQIGKLGTAVGRRWKRKMIYASYQGHVRNPRTEKQMLVRGRFKVLTQLANEMEPALVIGMKGYSDSRQWTERNGFMMANQMAVTGSSAEALEVDYEALHVSMGTLTGVEFGSNDFSQQSEVTATIEDPNVGTRALADDKVWLVAYCPDLHSVAVSDGTTKRTDGSVTVRVPHKWAGMKVHLYGFVQSSTKTTRVSESTYLGFGNIL